MSDLSDFNPVDVSELLDRLGDELTTVASDWWQENKDTVGGYLTYLATATLQTRAALAAGTIDEQYADIVMHDQELAFKQTLQFATFMTLVLAQQLYDAVFRVIGWVIFNRTGVNLWPGLVSGNQEG
jgi:hypothetical protein